MLYHYHCQIWLKLLWFCLHWTQAPGTVWTFVSTLLPKVKNRKKIDDQLRWDFDKLFIKLQYWNLMANEDVLVVIAW
jgi:hypothetical protein